MKTYICAYSNQEIVGEICTECNRFDCAVEVSVQQVSA